MSSLIRRPLLGRMLCCGALTALCLVAVPTEAAKISTFQEYIQSDLFEELNGRCATPPAALRQQMYGFVADPSDCSASSTNPTTEYAPDQVWEIQVVVHVVRDSSCSQGNVSDSLVESQIDILNEDFQAIFGTNGDFGNDSRVRFVLADRDPDGNPTNGITRSCNTTWYNDGGSYWNSLAWDPDTYMNVYTNNTPFLGYVPFLPADAGGAFVGNNDDRVVVTWSSFGRDAPIGPPYDQGRTLTHEVGHYLGLEHTFVTEGFGGCPDADAPGCYTSGDLICDTASESSPTYSNCEFGEKSTCNSIDPADNYMDYSDDLCMRKFTIEQVRRNRCTLEFYRPDLVQATEPGPSIDIDSITPLDPGVNNNWNVSGATPNGGVTVVCNLEDRPNQITVGTATANGSGDATVSRVVPGGAGGFTIECRAIDDSTNEQSLRFVDTF